MELNRVESAPAKLPVAPTQPESRLQTTPEVAQAVTAVNGAKLFGQDNELTFAMDRESRRTVIRLVDKKTREVIRQIPPETVLRLSDDLKDS